MKRKKLRVILIGLISFLFLSKSVLANDIKAINMDIFIDKEGNAKIKEVWQAKLNEGTEGYKPYYNLNNSKIENFQVTLNNKVFTTINNWDVDASFNAKKYKAGLHKIDDGYELCFGISEYGNNTYTLEYTLTNFVTRLDDADMVYWQLIPYDLSDKPESVYVKIWSDFRFADDLDVWGYGNYGGYAYVSDGYIELSNENGLDSDEYVTVLVKFPKNTFATSSVIDEDFAYYLNMAEEGAVHYQEKISFGKIILNILLFLVNLTPFIIVTIIIAMNANKPQFGTKNLKFSKDYRKFKDVPYFRDIPCDKDIFKAYWLACQYGLIAKETDFLGAVLLKWLQNDNIENTSVTSKILKKEERAIKLKNKNQMSELEMKLFDMMMTSSNDGILESNEFTKWCKNNYNKILKWFNEVIDNVTMEYVSKGLIRTEKKTFSTSYIVSDTLKEEAKKMYGLKQFLNEFSVIAERESIEVKLWNEYLIYAQIFGIADKVAKEFKKLYPDILTDDYYNDIIFINMISHDGIKAATTARDKAISYSSGGGGFSSSGGGGGSFGGGGGGGGFR